MRWDVKKDSTMRVIIFVFTATGPKRKKKETKGVTREELKQKTITRNVNLSRKMRRSFVVPQRFLFSNNLCHAKWTNWWYRHNTDADPSWAYWEQSPRHTDTDRWLLADASDSHSVHSPRESNRGDDVGNPCPSAANTAGRAPRQRSFLIWWQ